MFVKAINRAADFNIGCTNIQITTLETPHLNRPDFLQHHSSLEVKRRCQFSVPNLQSEITPEEEGAVKKPGGSTSRFVTRWTSGPGSDYFGKISLRNE